VLAHENKHVTQWTSEAPWKDLFNANTLYSTVLSGLTSNVSEADLRSKIFNAVSAKNMADQATATSTRCDREAAAFLLDATIAPDFLEYPDPDWRPSYPGC
jgi:hypothetical protein